jgi:hypothetical protein
MNNGNDNSLATGPGPSRRAVLSGGAAVLAAIGAGALVPATARAAPRIPAAGSAAVTGASASVSANGTYTVTTPSPAFTFTGTVGASATNISASTAGSDAVGAYHEIEFQYTAGGYARTASIRTYDSLPVVLFGTTYVNESDNVSPYYAFPAFSTRPSLTYSETFAVDSFGPYVFNTTGDPGFSPYLAFDSAGAYLISAASHFDTGVIKTINGAFSSVLSDGIASIPAGLNYRTVLVYGAAPAAVFSQWGKALTGWSGKARPAQSATTILAKLGYWTDHVYGYYYYSSELPGVLQQVRTHWESIGVPMGYLQLDSWWYPRARMPRGPTARTASTSTRPTRRCSRTGSARSRPASEFRWSPTPGGSTPLARTVRSTPCRAMWSPTRRTGTTA